MSVKKKDRNVAGNLSLEKAHRLLDYILILTRPEEYDRSGKRIQRAGHLGYGQPFQVFGLDIIKYGKAIQSSCYDAYKTVLRDEETWLQKTKSNRQAVGYCDQILKLVDYCIYHYAKNSKKKRKSFEHLAKLTYQLKLVLLDRINRDKLIYERCYKVG